jgi:hypothetical protein
MTKIFVLINKKSSFEHSRKVQILNDLNNNIIFVFKKCSEAVFLAVCDPSVNKLLAI